MFFNVLYGKNFTPFAHFSVRFAVKKMENVRWVMELILLYHLLTHLNNYHSLSIPQKN